MRSPVPEPPPSPIIFTYSRAESLLPDVEALPSHYGSVTPIPQAFATHQDFKREDGGLGMLALVAMNDPYAIPNPALQNHFPSPAPYQTPMANNRGNTTAYSEMSLVRETEPPEQISRRIVQNVHDICVDASRGYIEDFKRNVELHQPDPARESPSSSSSDSDSSGHRSCSGKDTLLSHIYRHERATDSLKANVSTVCTIMWAQGRHFQTWCPTSESVAIYDMGRINEVAANLMAAQHRPNHESRLWTKGVLRDGIEFCRFLRQPQGLAQINRMGREYFELEWDDM